MPAYLKIQDFMQRVTAVNASFEKWKKSSLRPLINVLNDNNGSLQKVQTALTGIPPAKAYKYKTALYYLLATYPGLGQFASRVNFGLLGKLNTAKFTLTNLPNPYDPALPTADRVAPPSAFLNMTVEQYLLSHPATGVMLIHLSDHDAGMDMIFNGESYLDHIKSVLRVAKDVNCDLCVLYMKNPMVLAALNAEVNAINGKTLVLEARQHMGARKQEFLTFAQNHQDVVVIGFDATICVEANLFGAADKMDDGSYVPPLTTITNVVTSRAVLVTTGTIYPKINKGQWGCLFKT
jgi:hypothetical protein